MNILQYLIKFIAGHEGKVLRWYLDPTGTPTIAFGATWASKYFRDFSMKKWGRKFRRGDTVTEKEAMDLLEKSIEGEYRPPVTKFFAGGKVSAHALDAATSFVYNAGAGALRWKWAKFIKNGDIKEGAKRWRSTAITSKGRKFAGLVRRRKEEADIAELNRYPAWVTGKIVGETRGGMKDIYENIKQAQKWLNQLGYGKLAVDGVAGAKTKHAVKKFQKAHPNLTVDGIIGVATLSALQRATDLIAKAKGTGAVGVATGGTGALETGAGALPDDISWIGDALLYGGLFILVVGLIWLAIRYRDEIKIGLDKL